jgi:hypothetical protein
MQPTHFRACPKCGTADYTFRRRKTIPAKESEPEAVETKYRCRACQREWRIRVVRKTDQGEPRDPE